MKTEPKPRAAAEPAAPVGKGRKADPAMQENYDKVVLAAMKFLYDDATHPEIMKMLQSGAGDPSGTLAKVAALIVTQLDQKAGGSIPREVVMHAAMEVLGLVAELADKAGVFTVDKAIFEGAARAMVAELQQKFGEQPAQAEQQVAPVAGAEQAAAAPAIGLVNQAMQQGAMS